MLEVHEFVPTLMPNDAVGNHILGVTRALRESGVSAAIWAGAVHPQLSRTARRYHRFERSARSSRQECVLVYEAASFSCGLVDFLLSRPEPKVISYHNLTPAVFYAPYDGREATELQQAARELRALAAATRVAIAASEFNAADLRRLGVAEVHVVPPFLGPTLSARPDPQTLDQLRASRRGIDVLFVGRLAPHKGHAHLVRLVAALRAAVDPNARLLLVGAPGPPVYMHSLSRLAKRLAPGAVVLVGRVDDAQLAAYYAHADVFVCLSDHEGFGIPLIEAMRARVPVVAYDAGAVRETLGGAGVLVGTRDPTVLAEVVARVSQDADLRQQLIERQLQRAEELTAFPRVGRWLEALSKALG